jgi:quercetin dioxygenase-like cupin family protein
MITEAINFDVIEWKSPLHGARFKAYQQEGRQIRLVEFTNEFVEADWCTNGHIGYVLEGTLEIDFRGRVVIYPPGSGIFISPGSDNAHKGRSVTSVVRLILVEEQN